MQSMTQTIGAKLLTVIVLISQWFKLIFNTMQYYSVLNVFGVDAGTPVSIRAKQANEWIQNKSHHVVHSILFCRWRRN